MTKCPDEDQRTIQAWNKVYYPHSAVYLKVKILLLLLLFSEKTFQSLYESVDFYVIENGFIFLFTIHFEWIAVCWFNSIPVIVVTLGLIRAWHHLSNFEHNHGDTQAHADRESEFQGVRWSWTWSWTHYNMSVFLAVTPQPTHLSR